MGPQLILFQTLLMAAGALAQRAGKSAGVWSQCGGSGYAGPTACVTGNFCKFGNPWYSQCVPGEADEPLSFIPDQPIVTNTRQTIVTINPGAQPTIVTTVITYLTPGPTSTQAQPPPDLTVISGTTYTIIHDTPFTGNKARDAATVAAAAPEPTTFATLPRD